MLVDAGKLMSSNVPLNREDFGGVRAAFECGNEISDKKSLRGSVVDVAIDDGVSRHQGFERSPREFDVAALDPGRDLAPRKPISAHHAVSDRLGPGHRPRLCSLRSVEQEVGLPKHSRATASPSPRG